MLYFENESKFDLDAMLTLGVSVKENDNAIGYFGTGFKYAAAIILRLGGTIEVCSHGEVIRFTTRASLIRGKEFHIVQANGVDKGFTTDLGKNWEPWMAYRELYCNAMDEGGTVGLVQQGMYTCIRVDCKELEEAHANKDSFILKRDLICVMDDIEIHRGSSNAYYYKGIRVASLSKPSFYTYNFLSEVELTEDRTAKYPFMLDGEIAASYVLYGKEDNCYAVFGNELTHEWTFGLNSFIPPCEAFMNAIGRLLKTEGGASPSARALHRLANAKKENFDSFELSPVQRVMYTRAVLFLQQLEINIEDFPVFFVTGLGDSISGIATNGRIYISPLAFQKGTKDLASTLMEEWCHLTLNTPDFSRKIQTWLFDKIIYMGELYRGEPL